MLNILILSDGPEWGKDMVEKMAGALAPECDHRFILLTSRANAEEHDLGSVLRDIAPGSMIISTSEEKCKGACGVLSAEEYIENDYPLMIVESGMYPDVDINVYLELLDGSDGVILTRAPQRDGRMSVITDRNGMVREINEAAALHTVTAGIFCYARGSDFAAGVHELEGGFAAEDISPALVCRRLMKRGLRFRSFYVGGGGFGDGMPDGEEKPVVPVLQAHRKIAVICPAHPAKYEYLEKCLESFYRFQLNWSADFWIIFSSGEDLQKWGGYEKFLVMPPEVDLTTRGVVNRKKLYAVRELARSGYDYLITIDADFSFISTVDLEFICERYFYEKTIIGNYAESELFARINRCCISHFRGNSRAADLPMDIYTWLNQPCIYKCDTVPEFFNALDFGNQLNKVCWEDFDYILYTYYLLLYQGFKLRVMKGWDHAAFAEAKSVPEGWDFGSVKDLRLLVSAPQKVNRIRMEMPESEIFMLIHCDRQ